jgi:hypothetical protein
LEKYLPSVGKGDSWVKATEAARPKYGDICLFRKLHVNVSLEFEGDTWTHVDGGQGGPKTTYDIVKRIRDKAPFDPARLAGWIDIELFFAASASQSVAPPTWLPGWWKVMWRSQPYYYYFDSRNQVKWTQMSPTSTTQPPSVSRDTGSVVVGGLSEITIRWGATGTIEKFSKSGSNQMRGTWKDIEPLTAAKL